MDHTSVNVVDSGIMLLVKKKQFEMRVLHRWKHINCRLDKKKSAKCLWNKIANIGFWGNYKIKLTLYPCCVSNCVVVGFNPSIATLTSSICLRKTLGWNFDPPSREDTEKGLKIMAVMGNIKTEADKYEYTYLFFVLCLACFWVLPLMD